MRKSRIASQEEAEAIKKEIEGKTLLIKKIEIKDKHVYPQPPFITSRLQQEASRKLRLSPKRTMMLSTKTL